MDQLIRAILYPHPSRPNFLNAALGLSNGVLEGVHGSLTKWAEDVARVLEVDESVLLFRQRFAQMWVIGVFVTRGRESFVRKTGVFQSLLGFRDGLPQIPYGRLFVAAEIMSFRLEFLAGFFHFVNGSMKMGKVGLRQSASRAGQTDCSDRESWNH
jgi:hypothetical protein